MTRQLTYYDWAPRGSDTVEPRGTTNIITAFSGQRQGDLGSMWDGGNGVATGTPRGGKRPRTSQPEDFSRRAVHSQDLSSRPTESTCQDHKRDQPRPGVKWRHHHRTWWASHVGCFGWRPRTTAAMDASALRIWCQAPGRTWTRKKAQVLEECIAEFQDVFATNYHENESTDNVYHRTDTYDAYPIRQPQRRLH
jgi:hypothetical protein